MRVPRNLGTEVGAKFRHRFRKQFSKTFFLHVILCKSVALSKVVPDFGTHFGARNQHNSATFSVWVARSERMHTTCNQMYLRSVMVGSETVSATPSQVLRLQSHWHGPTCVIPGSGCSGCGWAFQWCGLIKIVTRSHDPWGTNWPRPAIRRIQEHGGRASLIGICDTPWGFAHLLDKLRPIGPH